MCGIVAVLHEDRARTVDGALLSRMTDTLSHRGPDDRGTFVDGPVGLGHRRLSVIDLGGGHQPMCGPSGRTWIVYNGEVYNYRELRRELESAGVRFRTSSDTEVLLALYERLGPGFAARLNGMFAFAIWDQRDRSLVLGRDRVGVKPLYVWRGNGCLIAASEVKAILAHPEVPRRLRPDCLPELLTFGHLSGGRTPFDGVDAMDTATVSVHGAGQETKLRYWDLPEEAAASDRYRPARAGEELGALLEDSVRLRLIADVPIGTFNSGGLDSSIVTAIANRMTTGPIRSFSVGFRESAWDETAFARRLAESVGTVHEEILADARTFAGDLPSAIWHHDHPILHPNSLLIRRLSAFCKPKVTVVLTGEGADELFAGYPRYRLPMMLGAVPALPAVERAAAAGLRALFAGRRSRIIAASLGKPREDLIARNACRVLAEDVLDVCDGDAMETRLSFVHSGASFLRRFLRFELATYLHGVLERMDKMTMAAGLEARVPFLDYRIIEFAARNPTSLKRPWRKTKAVVRAAAKGLIPEDIAHRGKSGFGVPLAEWFRKDDSLGGYLGLLSERRTVERGWWKPERLSRLVDDHRNGRDHGELLWLLVNTELWARALLEQDTAARAGAHDGAGRSVETSPAVG